MLLHTDQLMPPLEIGFERFEENIWMVQLFQNGTGGGEVGWNWSTVDTMSVWIIL